MTTTGSGNFWNKKNKYTKCPQCSKKGYYKTTLPNKNLTQITYIEKCMFCDLLNEITEQKFKQKEKERD